VVAPYSDRISRVPPYSRIKAKFALTGLSPSPARLSRRFCLSYLNHWPGPRSLATTSGVSFDVLSCRYLDVSVPCVRLIHPIFSGDDTSNRGGLPHSEIRGSKIILSQRITSFFACACQGIHQMPLRHLITLIANTRFAGSYRVYINLANQSRLPPYITAGRKTKTASQSQSTPIKTLTS